MPSHELAGLNILVTRPRAQANGLCHAIQQHGGQPIALPLLEIQPLSPAPDSLPSETDLAQTELLIFISANAVDCGLPYLPPLPTSLRVGAIGQATAQRLQAVGIHTLVPARFDSEGFLALPQVQDLRDKTVIIVRGKGGREKLGESLHERGARLRYLEVYRRVSPKWTAGDVRTAMRADVITVTSGEALENLAQLAEQPGGIALRSKPLLVIHDRIAVRAQELGFTLKPIVTAQPGDDALLQALLHWANEQKGSEQA